MKVRQKVLARRPRSRSTDERSWWTSSTAGDSLMGVPAVSGGLMPAPLPADGPSHPAPGVGSEQADGEHATAFEQPESERLGS